MSDGVVRKRGRPKKVVVEAAVNNESNEVSKSAAKLDSNSLSGENAGSKKKLSEPTKKGSPSSRSLKGTVAEEPGSSTTTRTKRKSTKSVPEEAVSGDQKGTEAANDPSARKSKVKGKKGSSKVEGPSATATSASTGPAASKTKALDKATAKRTPDTKSKSVKASSSDAATRKTVDASSEKDKVNSLSIGSNGATGGSQTRGTLSQKKQTTKSLESNTQPESQSSTQSHDSSTSAASTSSAQSKSSISSSKILNALASQKSTSGSGKSSDLSSQKEDVLQSTEHPQSAISASSPTNASNPRPSNPLPPPKKAPTVLDSQAVKELNSRKGPSSKPPDIRATQQYKNAARKWTSTIVALPILIYTSYVIYERGILGKQRKRLPIVDTSEDYIATAPPSQVPKADGLS